MKHFYCNFRNFLLIIFLLIFQFFSFSLFAQNNKTVRIAYFDDDFFHIGQSDDAIKAGYGYEYYRAIAKYTGWQYEYVYGTKDELWQSFLDGKIDIFGDVSVNDSDYEVNLSKMLLSQIPMGVEHYFIAVSQFNQSISSNDIKTLNGKRIGVAENPLILSLLKNYIRQNFLNCQIVPCKNRTERLEKLQAGEVDAILTSEHFLEEGLKQLFYIGQYNFYFAVNKNRVDLLEQLNKTLTKIIEINPNFTNELRKKYFTKPVLHTSLSSEENIWLIQHPIIKIGYRSQIMPFADIGKNGNPTGVIADILNELTHILHAEFEAIPFYDIEEMLVALKNGEIDCAFPVINNEWFSEKLDYIQTFPILEDKLALIYEGEYKGINEYKHFGYIKGTPEQRPTLHLYGKIDDAVRFETLQESLKAFKKDEIDAMLLSASSWNYYRNSFPQYDLLKSVNIADSVGYSIALKSNNHILFSILQHGLSKIEKFSLTESVNRNSQLNSDYSLSNFIRHNLVGSMIFIFSLLLLIFVAILLLQKNTLKNRYLKFTSEHDALTGVFNRNAFNQVTEELANSNLSLSLVIIDIDNFKQINDNFGHEVGDKIIKEVSKQLMQITRSTDKVFRYGGDEFVLILPSVLIEHRQIISEKVASLNELLQNQNENLPSTTVSAGCAFSLNGYSKQLFRNADNALYTVKRQGKNNCGFELNVLK